MSTPETTITLQIDGSTAQAETVAGWNAEVFVLDGAARGRETALPHIDLPADAVLELELANGTRILVAADEAQRYLGSAVGRGDDLPEVIRVGQALRLSGPRLPAGVSREGLGAWILKGLRVFRQGPAGMTALIAAGSFQDAQLEHRNGLYRCATERWELSAVDKLPAAAEPTLVFLHGTASSSAGSFGALWENTTYREQLVTTYNARIYAFEHRSMTESPITNALDLVKTLPKDARLHLVSHSRGGMIGELLARANRIDQEPFTKSEIDRFLQHARHIDRKGFDAFADQLHELNQELRSRTIRVERFVRVACPARGTTLLAGKLDRWASVLFNLMGKGLDLGTKALPALAPVAKGYDLLQNFVLAVVRERKDAQILPGLEAMMPDSPLVALLNAPDVQINPPLHILAGDFKGDGLLPWLGDCLSEVYYGSETDLVVNTPSMSGGAPRVQGIRQKPLSGPQVHHLNYFKREESANALLKALKGDDSEFTLLDGPSQAVISRGGREIKRKDNAPIVFLLPGIMGSHIQVGTNRIWFEPFSMCTGGIKNLKINAQGKISADGWMDRNYEKLARYLADTHEVRPFAYDWRLSIVDAARQFGKELDRAMTDAKERGKPVRIVAHSMGGLVARLAMKDRWTAFKALPGSRLLQLGTPNRGSHSIAAVLIARDDFVQTIERWFDWRHNMREFLDIVSEFPGVLELLPWPDQTGLAIDGVDYFDEQTWKTWHAQDTDPRKETSWGPPRQAPLTAARAAIDTLRKADLEPECTLYVAGHAPTPIEVRSKNGQIEIGWIDEGDGRVPWKTGIPAGVPVWYADAVHGDLAGHEQAFEAYRELIENGTTRLLSHTPAGARGDTVPVFRTRSLTSNVLYPSADEVLAAATGGARPGRRPRAEGEAPAIIEVIHGSLASAESPILIGSYAGDTLRGSAKFLNDRLCGRLERAYTIGRYPCRTVDAMVFRQADPANKPAGAIVVGLGPVGDLLPGTLTQALSHGLLEYARICEQQSDAEPCRPERLDVSALLVGTGFTGLTVEAGTRCLLDALRRTNRTLRQANLKTRIGRITVFEEMESRAIIAVQTLRDLITESRFSGVATFDGRLRDGQGGYCGRSFSGVGQPGLYRVHVAAEGGALRFTVVTDRARNVVSAEPNQRQAVDGLIRSATRSTNDQPGLSRALFELLVPNSMKEIVADLRTLMLSVDPEAATYPWELMRDTDQMGEPPLAARVELIRQLASTHGRGRVQSVQNKRVFIVGDTQSGMIELPGARAEAKAVADCFDANSYEVDDHYGAGAIEVFDALFNGHYQAIHLAGHGVVKDKKTGLTGMVLGPETFLTSAQISKLRRVPEFVFINCCHLGSMEKDAETRWGQLAANLATEFIEMGCKAVIAAGWAVDDLAASTFARTFYERMFSGKRFAEAIRIARAETHRLHPSTNTWGAFQAYGDDRYRFPDVGAEDRVAQEYVHPSHLLADLNMLNARLKDATKTEKKEYYRAKITAIEDAARGTDFQHAGVREGLAMAWAELDDRKRAIGHYRAALVFEDAGLSLHALEQLANLEIRQGAKLLESKSADEQKSGDAYLQAGRDRLDLLNKIGPTIERLSLLGSYWKRRTQSVLAQCEEDDLLDVTPYITEWLTKMEHAYWQAAELSYTKTGSWDYYPLLNALEGAILSASWGDRGPLDQHTGHLPDLLAAAAENGRRRFADKREFFHALAEVEVERVNAWWACYDAQHTQENITDPTVLHQLIARYCDLFRRMGSTGEHDSVINQLHFVVALLPADKQSTEVKEALLRLIEGIKKA